MRTAKRTCPCQISLQLWLRLLTRVSLAPVALGAERDTSTVGHVTLLSRGLSPVPPSRPAVSRATSEITRAAVGLFFPSLTHSPGPDIYLFYCFVCSALFSLFPLSGELSYFGKRWRVCVREGDGGTGGWLGEMRFIMLLW